MPDELLQTSREARRFGMLLARYRKDAELSQRALASRSGLSRQGISMLESGATAVPRNGNLERLIAGLDLTPKQAALLRASARNAMEISPEISLDDTFWTPEHGALLLNLPLKVFLRLLKQNPDHFPTPFSTKAATPHLRWERSAWVDRFGQLTPHVETRSIQRAASVALRKKK